MEASLLWMVTPKVRRVKEDTAPVMASTGRAHRGLWVGFRVTTDWICAFLHPWLSARCRVQGRRVSYKESCDFVKQVKR